jgi:hypothetical protein
MPLISMIKTNYSPIRNDLTDAAYVPEIPLK